MLPNPWRMYNLPTEQRGNLRKEQGSPWGGTSNWVGTYGKTPWVPATEALGGQGDIYRSGSGKVPQTSWMPSSRTPYAAVQEPRQTMSLNMFKLAQDLRDRRRRPYQTLEDLYLNPYFGFMQY